MALDTIGIRREKKVDAVKDEIDGLLSIGDNEPRTERRMADRLDKARDLIEYIQLHYVDVLEADIAERRAEKRQA